MSRAERDGARWLGRGPGGDHWGALAGDTLTVSTATADAYLEGGAEGRALDVAFGELAAVLGRPLCVVSDDGTIVTVRHLPR